MKTSRITCLLISCLISVGLSAHADDLDLLQQLGESEEITSSDSLESLGDGDEDLSSLEGEDESFDDSFESLSDDSQQISSDESEISLTFNGYLKTILNWNRSVYSDELWTQYQQLAAIGAPVPQDQTEEKYTFSGVRAQASMEAFHGNNARLFSAFNLDYNTAEKVDTDGYESSVEQNQESQSGSIRIVESFIELYEGSRTWKLGTQLVTWGFMEGFEVPTDRLNARDNTYVSSEYEDTKLPASGILLTQGIGDSALDIVFIPVSKVNINPTFTEYLFPGGNHTRDTIAENSKWAIRFNSSLSKLDYAFSYIDGSDLQSDSLLLDATGDEMVYDASAGLNQILADMRRYNRSARTYHRLKSAGLDLQLSLDSWIPKLSAVQYLTEDEEGDDPFIKNNWQHYMLGGEFKLGSATLNLYAGQQVVENYQEETPLDSKTNYLNGQRRERTDILSGYLNADFLTGNALNLNLMFAGYWDDEGEPVEGKLKSTLKYKITNGLDVLFAVTQIEIENTKLLDVQAEVKASF